MKILIVSYWFPPHNVIGALRVGKFAKYLRGNGHEVRVIAGASQEQDRSLPLEIPPGDVTYAADWNVDGLFDPLLDLVRRSRRAARPAAPVAEGSSAVGAAGEKGISWRLRLRRALTQHYYAVLRIPDSKLGWRSGALRAGRALLAQWRPDLILASAPPVTALVVARRLGKEFGVPWVAELRDLWTDNPYYEHPAWRKLLDAAIERRVLGSAAMLVTVTPLWGETLKRKYDRPVHVVLNGYVAEDYPATVAAPDPAAPLSIVYTGNIYQGYRDPSPLFAAIALLGEERDGLRVHFYGPAEADVRGLAERHGVAPQIVVHRRVSYRESLAVQMAADVLLLMQWNNRADEGNIPAKFFEYLAAARPILFLGFAQGTVAQMIRERQAGLVANEPAAIAAQLAAWIAQRRHGAIPPLDPAAKEGLAREEQFRAFEKLLTDVTESAPGMHSKECVE